MEFQKLSFHFNKQKLQEDLLLCQQFDWALHYNKKDFTGNWSIFALRSISGKESDILALPNSTFQDTPTLKKCNYFKEIIDSFECPKEAIRLLSLAPNSYIKEHTDIDAGYENGFFRIHIPIQTNDRVVFTVNGQSLPMKVGECWYANFNLPHFVSNEGKTDRVHLVMDCIRNAWSDQLFAELGYDFEAEKKNENETKVKPLMIYELEKIWQIPNKRE